MFLTKTQLKAASGAIDQARADPSQRHYCVQPRLGTDGNAERFLEKPHARRIQVHPATKKKGFFIPHGNHGADFLQVNPETGEIRCGACAGDLDATVRDA